jgi:hypothetical protein
MNQYSGPSAGELPPVDQDLGTIGRQFSKKILEHVLNGKWPAEPHEEVIVREFKASGMSVKEFMAARDARAAK